MSGKVVMILVETMEDLISFFKKGDCSSMTDLRARMRRNISSRHDLDGVVPDILLVLVEKFSLVLHHFCKQAMKKALPIIEEVESLLNDDILTIEREKDLQVELMLERMTLWMRLLKIKAFIHLGDYESAEELATSLASKMKELEIKSSFLDQVIFWHYLSAQLFRKEHHLVKALKLVDRGLDLARTNELNDSWEMATCLTLKATIVWEQGHLKEASTFFSESLKLWEKIGNEFERSWALMGLASVMRMTGKEDEALQLFEQILEIRRQYQHHTGIIGVLLQLGLGYGIKGDWERALSCYQEGLEIALSIRNQDITAGIINNMGLIYHDMGKYDQALQYYEKSLKMWRELQDSRRIADSLNNIALIHQLRGNFVEARKLHLEALNIRETLHLDADVANSLLNLGQLHRIKGDLELARSYVIKSLEMREAQGNVIDIAESLRELGLVNWMQGHGERALDDLKRSLHLYQQHGNAVEEAAVLHYLIKVVFSVKMESHYHLVPEWLKQLEQLRRKDQNPIIDEKYLFCKGYVLKHSHLYQSQKSMYDLGTILVNQSRALKIFQRLQNSRSFKDFEVFISSFLNGLELLLIEYELSEDHLKLEAFQKVLTQLHQLALRFDLKLLLIEVHWLQSKLALAEGKLALSEQLLTKAINLAEKQEITQLVWHFRREIEDIRSLIRQDLDGSPSSRLSAGLSELNHLIKLLDQGLLFAEKSEIKSEIKELSTRESRTMLKILQKKFKQPFFS